MNQYRRSGGQRCPPAAGTTVRGETISTVLTSEPSSSVRSGFTQWAELWSHLGLWLSLWDEQCKLIEQVGPDCSFWNSLARHSSRFRDRLRQTARKAQQGETLLVDLDAQGTAMAIAVPLTHRHRNVGSVVACGACERFLDEENFARFCDACRVDRSTFHGLAAGLVLHRRDLLHGYARILADHAESHGASALAHREIHNLSSHLAHTYEELHLLYRFSASISVARSPTTYFEQICNELLDTTVIRSFAVVLEPPAYLVQPLSVVRAGSVAATDDDVVRLYHQLRDRTPNADTALVVSEVADDPELAWASGWLKQCVFYWLEKKDRRLGGLLAINHVDETQFDSYEIQLVNAVAERSAAFLENVQLYDDLERLFSGMLHALVSSIDAKDPYTCGHSQRVAWLSRHIAGLCGLSEEQCERVYLSGLLHDVGKIGISETVLCKAGRLTREEFEEMRRHPEIGARIVEGVPQVADTIPGILHHHERMDGKGYPAGLAGYEIPLLGRFIGLADSYDAMTTNRTYRQARPIQVAMAEVRRCSGTQFDPEIAHRFLQQDIHAIHRQVTDFGNQPIGTRPHRLSLSSGDLAAPGQGASVSTILAGERP